MACKPKKKYNVFLMTQREYNGLGVDEETPHKTLIGATYAVTPEKAINNVSYREGIRAFDVLPMWGDGACFKWLHAEEVHNGGLPQEGEKSR